MAQWQDPFEMMRRVGPVDYEVYQPGKKKLSKIYHAILLKEWKEQEPEPELSLEALLALRPGEASIGQDSG